MSQDRVAYFHRILRKTEEPIRRLNEEMGTLYTWWNILLLISSRVQEMRFICIELLESRNLQSGDR